MADLAEIKEYLSQFYESTVRKFISDLNRKISQLMDFPYLYPKYEKRRRFRKMVIGNYLVFYVVDEDTKTVEIHRIFHGSRDVPQHLK
jgi:plasmid stabilization system protein ParE